MYYYGLPDRGIRLPCYVFLRDAIHFFHWRIKMTRNMKMNSEIRGTMLEISITN
jgi:hypothetical protein